MSWRDYKDHQNILNSHVDQGKVFDAGKCYTEIHSLADEIRQHDPRGGCWEWIEMNLADTWRQLMEALKEIDTAFQKQCRGDLLQTIALTRRLYFECVSAWRDAEVKG